MLFKIASLPSPVYTPLFYSLPQLLKKPSYTLKMSILLTQRDIEPEICTWNSILTYTTRPKFIRQCTHFIFIAFFTVCSSWSAFLYVKLDASFKTIVMETHVSLDWTSNRKKGGSLLPPLAFILTITIFWFGGSSYDTDRCRYKLNL